MAGVIVQPGTGLQGPAGPTGATGPAGATGATGPAGPAGGAVASADEVQVTVTTGQTILTYTPTTSGPFLIGLYLRVITAATTVSAVVTYTDATGAQSQTLQASSSLAVGSYPLDSLTIDAVAGDAIDVVVTAGTANQVYASAAIWGTASGAGGATGKAPVQSAVSANSNVASLALTLGAAPTDGNVLFALIGSSASTVTGVTQTGVTWSKLLDTGLVPDAELWKGVVGAGAGTTVTVAFAAASYSCFHVSEWAGLTGTVQVSSVSAATTTGYATGIIVPTSTAALVLAVMATSSGTTAFSPIAGGQGGMANFAEFATTDVVSSGPLGLIIAGWCFPGTVPTAMMASAGSGNHSFVIAALT